MPKRKEPELDPTEQYERFKKAAKNAELTESEQEFERAFRKVVPLKKMSKAKPRR